MERRVTGTALVSGVAEGPLLSATEPLSFWGGWDPRTGEIIDRRHPLSGRMGAGTVLAIPFTRGSSTTTAILLESVRSGTAPVAILCTASDPFLALAAVVADELFNVVLPVVVLAEEDMAAVIGTPRVRVEADGSVVFRPAP